MPKRVRREDDSPNNSRDVNVCNNCTVAHQRTELLTWLSPLEPKLRHRDIQDRRVDSLGEWLMQTEEFKRWKDGSGEVEGDKAVLFFYGNPGVGKTFISSLVVDSLCNQTAGQNTSVTCFYFDFAARKEQCTISTLGSLLRQMVSGMETIPEEISRAFQVQKNAIGRRGPQLSDIVKMLQIITTSRRTFICLDALDECGAVQRVKFLDSLNKIVEKSPDTRIFVMGRSHIRTEIEKHVAGRRVASLSVGPRNDDIIEYLRARLGQDETPEAMDDSLEADILQEIPEKMSEMFLLVSLSIEAILQESTIHRRREKLGKMADGLGFGDAYGATIERIMAQGGDKSRLGIGVLMWISHAERPLRADELCHALAVEIDSINFNPSNIPLMSTLVGCCQGLITVDKEASTVRLIHFTLQEYLSAHPDIFGCPQSTMAEICLTYLNLKQVEAFSPGHSPRTQDAPFLEYCSVYWGIHAKRKLSHCARSLALRLFQKHDRYSCTESLSVQGNNLDPRRNRVCSRFSGLHCASRFGIVGVVAALIETGDYGINDADFRGHTPLAWAAHNGHKETVTILLRQRDINPDKPNNNGRTPLSHAASNGYEGVVKILLRREAVNPNKPDNDGRIPLSFAAQSGHTGVVKILLRRGGASPDRPDNSGRSPLSYAAWYGHEGVMKVLLAVKGVIPDRSGNGGQTPLSYAAWYGHEGAVKILLGLNEVIPGRQDRGGRTPLLLAALNGHEGVVKILLAQEEVNPNKPDNDGRTPLSHAASTGHEGVVKMLLARQDIRPHGRDDAELTPLCYARRKERQAVVKLLQ